MRPTEHKSESTELSKEYGIHPITNETKELSSKKPVTEKVFVGDEKVCLSRTTLNASWDAALAKEYISYQRDTMEDINEYPQYGRLNVEDLKTSSKAVSIQREDEKYSVEIMNQSLAKRRNILRELNEEEKIKFMKIESDVAKLGLPQQAIDIIQFLIVSHWDLPECLDRMKRLKIMEKDYKIDTVTLADGITQMRERTEMFRIGGYDPDGRRVVVVNFGKLPAARLSEEFPAFCKMMKLLFDAVFVTLLEIEAGIAFVGDFEGYGTSNWSLKLFIKFMKIWQYNYPIRVRRIYFVNTPTFFWVIAQFVMAFTPKKFKERFRFLSIEDLYKVIPRTSLPDYLGGTYEETKIIVGWVQQRLEQRYGQDWKIHYS